MLRIPGIDPGSGLMLHLTVLHLTGLLRIPGIDPGSGMMLHLTALHLTVLKLTVLLLSAMQRRKNSRHGQNDYELTPSRYTGWQ
jgi:hypothetical protein